MRPEVFATNLVEANVGGLLTEALTADVQAVLADETGLVGADTAVIEKIHMLALRSLETCSHCHFCILNVLLQRFDILFPYYSSG